MSCTFKKNIVSHNPFFSCDVAIVESVEKFEYPVHQNIIRHVEDVVEELSEGVPVHGVQILRVLAVQLEQFLNLQTCEVCPLDQALCHLLLLFSDHQTNFTHRPGGRIQGPKELFVECST